jgi:sugar lactone lactonase YvrE
VAGGSSPLDVAVAPNGKSAYVTNNTSAPPTISQYDIDPSTGDLTPKTPPTVSAGMNVQFPAAIALSPDGGSAYVSFIAAFTSPVVAQFSIDPVTGALSPKTPAAVAGASGSHFSLAVTPDGRSAYLSSFDTIWQYNVDSVTGNLSPKSPASIATPDHGGAMAVSPDGKSAYASCPRAICQYDIDPLTGVLSPKSPATVASGPSVFDSWSLPTAGALT